ncbi:MAG: hypothetical protein ACE14M_06335 [Terriglobales bacterium]
MSKFLLLLCFLPATWMWSQQTQTKPQVMRGCIYQASRSTYSFRDASGDDWQVHGDPKVLKHYAGMEVNLSTKPAESTTPSTALSISNSSQSLQITKVHVIQECLVDPYGFLHR